MHGWMDGCKWCDDVCVTGYLLGGRGVTLCKLLGIYIASVSYIHGLGHFEFYIFEFFVGRERGNKSIVLNIY